DSGDAAEPDLTAWPPAGAEPVTPADPRDDVRGVWRRGEETFLELVLPDEFREDAEDFGIHPLLLDAASRAVDGDRAPGSATLWRDVALHATGARSLRVRLSPAGQGTALTAADEAGRPVLTAGRIATRTAPRPRLATPGGALRIEWTELDRQTAAAPPRTVPVNSDEAVLDLGDDPSAVTAAVAVLDVPLGEPPVVACRRALAVAQAWLDEPALAGLRLVVRTRNAVPIEPGTMLDPAAAAVRGMIAAVQTEHPDRFVLVDVDPDDDPDAGLGSVPADGAAQAAVRAGRVHLPRLVPVAGAGPAVRPLDPAGTVLIVGGTGRAGSRVARQLIADHGVRHLVLAGRRGPDAPGAADLVAELAGLGASATVVACDVTDRDAIRRLLSGIPAEHPLTGVVHAAGMADRTPLAELDPERLGAVLEDREASLRHLAELAEDRHLALFAVVTTTAELAGPADGVATGAADGLARAAAARHGASAPMLASADGTAATALSAAIDTAERFPVPGRPAEWGAPAPGLPVPPLLRGFVRPRRRPAYRAEAEAENTGRWTELLSSRVAAEREKAVLHLVQGQLARVLGLNPDEPVEPEAGFFEVGMDSLLALDLTRRLNSHAGTTLTPAAVFNNPTPAELARYLIECLAPAE
ncbi:beta-ketoacyl reductase, partial [Amycolatopsis japonica]|uniref:type I polyketide synthase n=1 Tax=Amycolatopsis japonica TaxID=208439 RepID=UPI00331E607A